MHATYHAHLNTLLIAGKCKYEIVLKNTRLPVLKFI